ncbi:MAG: 30S ribosomal protein S14 [Puniceicoccales bacterium]|jgi:small subunit ribosomal protein S14|nr:30S ribosomal protein S14 [Puniceicoccales bacterium]
MAKKSSIARNEKRIRMELKFREKRAALKAILANPTAEDGAFFNAQRLLAKLPKNSCAVRIRNRCALTGRARGFHRRFGVSRLVLRELVAYGSIPGVMKSSW